MKVEVIKELHGLKIGTQLNCEPNSCLIKKGYVKPIDSYNEEKLEPIKPIQATKVEPSQRGRKKKIDPEIKGYKTK